MQSDKFRCDRDGLGPHRGREGAAGILRGRPGAASLPACVWRLSGRAPGTKTQKARFFKNDTLPAENSGGAFFAPLLARLKKCYTKCYTLIFKRNGKIRRGAARGVLSTASVVFDKMRRNQRTASLGRGLGPSAGPPRKKCPRLEFRALRGAQGPLRWMPACTSQFNNAGAFRAAFFRSGTFRKHASAHSRPNAVGYPIKRILPQAVGRKRKIGGSGICPGWHSAVGPVYMFQAPPYRASAAFPGRCSVPRPRGIPGQGRRLLKRQGRLRRRHPSEKRGCRLAAQQRNFFEIENRLF